MKKRLIAVLCLMLGLGVVTAPAANAAAAQVVAYQHHYYGGSVIYAWNLTWKCDSAGYTFVTPLGILGGGRQISSVRVNWPDNSNCNYMIVVNGNGQSIAKCIYNWGPGYEALGPGYNDWVDRIAVRYNFNCGRYV